MEIKKKKTLNSQSNLKKEEWNWRKQPAWLQTILQNPTFDSLLSIVKQTMLLLSFYRD